MPQELAFRCPRYFGTPWLPPRSSPPHSPGQPHEGTTSSRPSGPISQSSLGHPGSWITGQASGPCHQDRSTKHELVPQDLLLHREPYLGSEAMPGSNQD
jgi:hypothetical protein